jgi:signal transduction histidine kinase
MKVLIADDHGIVRSGLRLLLERQPDIEVIGEAADGAEAREMAVRERPDLAILDVKMPKLTGLQATREIKRQAPGVSVLILSMHDDERYLFEALKAGASGYVLKAQADTDLLAAIRAVERGEPFLTPEAQRTLIKDVLERGSSGEEELEETKSLANQAMRELLSLARQLRPTPLDDLGLAAAVAGQVEQVARSGIASELVTDGDFSDLDSDVQLVVYRVAQEALSNAARHSQAERIAVELRRAGDGVGLDVSDDGRGFAFEQSERGLGIAGMRERALLLGGDLTIESRPGRGTTVSLRV